MTATVSHGTPHTSPGNRTARGQVAEGRGVSRVALAVLEAFTAVGAYVGGYTLVTGGYDMPEELLDSTPFASWTWPGTLLVLVVALPMTVAVVLEIAGARRAFTASVSAGVLLVGWILVQMAVIGYQMFLQPAMLVVGLLVVLLAYLAHPSSDG